MTPQKPAHQIRLSTLKAAIWANPTVRGTVRYSVTVQRIYKDRGLWRRSETFRRDDLLTLVKLLDLAHTWILQQPARPPAAGASPPPAAAE